jgi:hypothetical protein
VPSDKENEIRLPEREQLEATNALRKVLLFLRRSEERSGGPLWRVRMHTFWLELTPVINAPSLRVGWRG